MQAMKLEVRTSNGNLIAKCKNAMASVTFCKLSEATELFSTETKKLITNNKESKDYFCFVAIECSKFNITNDFELWFATGDYVKVIR